MTCGGITSCCITLCHVMSCSVISFGHSTAQRTRPVINITMNGFKTHDKYHDDPFQKLMINITMIHFKTHDKYHDDPF